MKKHSSPAIHLLALTVLLLSFGLMMIYSASVAEALRDFGDKFYFAKLQLKWAGVGLLGLIICSRINLKALERFAPALLLVGLILLFLVVVPGIGVKVQGARRWLFFGSFNLQPSELIKLVEIVYLSSWLNRKKVTLVQFLSLVCAIALLILAQPDMGTTVVVVIIAVSMYYLAGYPALHIGAIGAVGAVLALLLIVTSPYRLSRLNTFLNPARDPLGSSYHIRQILLALGSGGVFGVGVGKSRQKHEYLPESTTDSIFAVVGEELGFIGAAVLVLAFFYLLYLGSNIATRAKSSFEKSLAGGITVWLASQIFLNLTSMVALAPLTGVPLPLVSYGGSALITSLLGIGLLLNVSRANSRL